MLLNVKKIHKTNCNVDTFPSFKKETKKAIEICTFLTNVEKKKVLNFLKNIKEEETCLHSRMHFGNLILSRNKKYWIDLSSFSYGNPLFDLGTFYYFTNSNQNVYENLFHLTKDQLQKCWIKFLSFYYNTNDSSFINDLSNRIKPYSIFYIIRENFLLGSSNLDDIAYVKNIIKII